MVLFVCYLVFLLYDDKHHCHYQYIFSIDKLLHALNQYHYHYHFYKHQQQQLFHLNLMILKYHFHHYLLHHQYLVLIESNQHQKNIDKLLHVLNQHHHFHHYTKHQQQQLFHLNLMILADHFYQKMLHLQYLVLIESNHYQKHINKLLHVLNYYHY